jgi:hypothetical protein
MITVNLLTILVLAIIGLICLVVARTVPFGGPTAGIRILLLVVGWICAGIATILFVIWLVLLLTHGGPLVVAAA